MSKLLIISKGQKFICQFDQRDKTLITRFKWSLHSKGYAMTTIKGKTVLMHRLILGIVDNPEIEADHFFHNRLDNRRAKIRVCTHSENRRNSRKLKGISIFKGVYKDGNLWHSQILQGQKTKNLGRFRSEITAAKIYDQAAKETFKDFAFLNFPGFNEVEQISIPGF